MFSDVRESLPQTLANLEIVIDMLKRYHKGVEQTLVILPAGRRGRAGGHASFENRACCTSACRSTSRRRA